MSVRDETPNWIIRAQEELGRIRGRGSAKKRATILALAKARLVGLPEYEVFDRPDTCSRRTYYRDDPGKDGKPLGWKHDPLFMDVLEAVVRIALEWRNEEKLQEIQDEQEYFIQTSRQLSRALFEKAQEMLQFPLYEVTVPDEQGGNTIIQPARWTFNALPNMVRTAQQLNDLSISRARQNLESDDWRLSLPPGVNQREAELMVERIADLLVRIGEEAQDEEEQHKP